MSFLRTVETNKGVISVISISSTCHITRALAPKQKGHPHTRSWPQPCPEPHFLTKHDPDPDFEGPWYEVPTTKTLLLRVEYEDHRIELWYTEHSTPAPGAPSSIFVRNPPPPPSLPGVAAHGRPRARLRLSFWQSLTTRKHLTRIPHRHRRYSKARRQSRPPRTEGMTLRQGGRETRSRLQSRGVQSREGVAPRR